MTYARSRLWLGITSVGTIVCVCTWLLVSGLIPQVFPTATDWGVSDLWFIAAFVGGILLIAFPFDVIGGYILPNRYARQDIALREFIGSWFIGVTLQATLYIASGLAILAVGRMGGLWAVVALLPVCFLIYVFVQGSLIRLLTPGYLTHSSFRLQEVEETLKAWGLRQWPIKVIRNTDVGFTGGICGLPAREKIVIPYSWLEKLSPNQLAVAIARRAIAIQSGSRNLGLVLASLWILFGFAFSASLPGAGVETVAELIATCCWFTLWTFFGLLILPTVSRTATYRIDKLALEHGVPKSLLTSTLTALDRLQDDEPQRPTAVETIFHPVPSISNRITTRDDSSLGAWNLVRTVLFLSWCCMGLLSRAVHCNAGRPELWVMLPTD